MIPKVVKKPLRMVRNEFFNRQTERYLLKIQNNTPICDFDKFDYYDFKTRVLEFIESMRVGNSQVQFRYSASCTQPTLYASVYACMTYSLLGELGEESPKDRRQWIDYFDSFQRQKDGLFYDPVVKNDLYDDSDWWGARHLTLHMISAYKGLCARPKYPFKFLEKYYDLDFVEEWLGEFDWESVVIGEGDIDNKLMNIGCLLQYSRDEWGDEKAGISVGFIKEYLLENISLRTGMWGGFDAAIPDQRSRMVQFAYHIFPLFFYDDYFDFDELSIVELTLKTQNKLGGFGVKLNSSACEDIDSIDLLIRLMPYVAEDRQAEILKVLGNACRWVLCNQVGDGGFVFRLNEAFIYGGKETSSGKNEGAMLPTWFRVLSIAYLTRTLGIRNQFVITQCPGYEFI